MTAYLIHLEPVSGYRDAAAMARYAENVGAIVTAFGGTYHARHQKMHVLEGPWDREYITLIEFPSQQALLNFYESAQYRPWLLLRASAGDGVVVMVGR